MDPLVGSLMIVLGSMLPAGYLLADGSCHRITEYPKLARVMHEGSNWPYGLCSPRMFRLPDLRCKHSKHPPCVGATRVIKGE